MLNGRGLSEALAAAPFVPGGAAEMIATAERTGTLGEVAQVIGEYYEEEGETRLRELTTVIEPLIIVGMGLVVACMVCRSCCRCSTSPPWQRGDAFAELTAERRGGPKR